MPKINVYLPDDLAAAVRESGIAVSPICQRALSEAVRSVDRARRTVAALRDPDFDPASLPQIGAGLERIATDRLRDALGAAAAAAADGPIETRHLLLGIVDEGSNLAVRVLRALDVEPDELRPQLSAARVAEPPSTSGAAAGTGLFQWDRFTLPARRAIASSVEIAVEMTHNYLGCEHLLIGLLDVEGSGASSVLQELGVNRSAAVRSVQGALAGVVHERQNAPKSDGALGEILRRLDALERRLQGLGG